MAAVSKPSTATTRKHRATTVSWKRESGCRLMKSWTLMLGPVDMVLFSSGGFARSRRADPASGGGFGGVGRLVGKGLRRSGAGEASDLAGVECQAEARPVRELHLEIGEHEWLGHEIVDE